MIVKSFMNTCAQYDNFMVWDVENMNAFFEGNGVLAEIFAAEFKFPVEEFDARRGEIDASNLEIMESLLDLVGDKHFFVFTKGSQNHNELIQMQDTNIMNFGIQIQDIADDHVYIIVMDKLAS